VLLDPLERQPCSKRPVEHALAENEWN